MTAKEVGGPVPRDIGTHSELTNAQSARMKKLLDLLGDPELEEPEKTRLQELLASNHQAFCIEDGEQGKTELVQMEINTGDSTPIKQSVRRMPFSVRQEVARQIQDMQKGH